MRPICGLLLAGGRSRRMGLPKETLFYHSEPESERIYEILRRVTSEVFYSIREEQRALPAFSGRQCIIDAIDGGGPLAALNTAFHYKKEVSWLLAPVDMPLLETEDFEALIEAHSPEAGITAFENGRGGYELLPAIYDASLAAATDRLIRSGRMAFAGLGDEIIPRCIPHKNPERLININTAQERKRFLEKQ